MLCMSSLGGTIIILSKVGEVGFVEVFDLYSVVGGVHSGVVHVVLDALLLGELLKLILCDGTGKVCFQWRW